MWKLCFLLAWSGIALLLLTACEPGTPGSASPGGSSSTNTSPSTQTTGPIVITTDHSVYKSTEFVRVTIHNTLSMTIYARDTKASCSILDLQVSTNGNWQPASVARCGLSRPSQEVSIAPAGTYSTTIQANVAGLDNAVFPAGTYRLLLSYATTPGKPNLALPSSQFVVQGTIVAPQSTQGGTQPTIVSPPKTVGP